MIRPNMEEELVSLYRVFYKRIDMIPFLVLLCGRSHLPPHQIVSIAFFASVRFSPWRHCHFCCHIPSWLGR